MPENPLHEYQPTQNMGKDWYTQRIHNLIDQNHQLQTQIKQLQDQIAAK